MTVLLLRPYATFAQGATIDVDNATEASLVAQGFATYTINPGPAFGPLTAAEQQILRDSSPATLNVLRQGTSLNRWGAALAAMRAGTRNAKLLVISDSTSVGACAVSSSIVGPNQLSFSWPYQLAPYFVANGIPANTNSLFGDPTNQSVAATLSSVDPRRAYGANWLFGAISSLGGKCAYNITAGSQTAMSFTPTSSFDTITVCYLRNTGYGSFSIAVDGGAALTTVNAAGAAGLIEVTVTCPVGARRIDIYRSAPTGADGGIVIQWVRTSLSTVRCVEILNAGVNSTGTAAQSDSSFNYTPIGAVQVLAPDLTIICLDINDWSTALASGLYDNATAATHNLQLQKIITNAEITGDVILMTGAPSRISTYTRAQQDPTLYVTRLLAQINSCPLVDVSAEWGDWVAASAAGYYLPSGSDIHPGAAGYANIALQVSRVKGLYGT